jgi:hypothetical protein
MGRTRLSVDGCYRRKTNSMKRDLLSGLSPLFMKGPKPMDKAEAETLASKHAAIHAMIDEEEHRPHPNEDLLHQLKKEKLRLKDELSGHYEK